MAVSEDDIREEDIIQEDFKKAKEIMERIEKRYPVGVSENVYKRSFFVLCLIYVSDIRKRCKK